MPLSRRVPLARRVYTDGWHRLLVLVPYAAVDVPAVGIEANCRYGNGGTDDDDNDDGLRLHASPLLFTPDRLARSRASEPSTPLLSRRGPDLRGRASCAGRHRHRSRPSPPTVERVHISSFFPSVWRGLVHTDDHDDGVTDACADPITILGGRYGQAGTGDSRAAYEPSNDAVVHEL
jgi:hypothetical protein